VIEKESLQVEVMVLDKVKYLQEVENILKVVASLEGMPH
jgi:hypothetical protein